MGDNVMILFGIIYTNLGKVPLVLYEVMPKVALIMMKKFYNIGHK
jgi:hypothetical protein